MTEAERREAEFRSIMKLTGIKDEKKAEKKPEKKEPKKAKGDK